MGVFRFRFKYDRAFIYLYLHTSGWVSRGFTSSASKRKRFTIRGERERERVVVVMLGAFRAGERLLKGSVWNPRGKGWPTFEQEDQRWRVRSVPGRYEYPLFLNEPMTARLHFNLGGIFGISWKLRGLGWNWIVGPCIENVTWRDDNADVVN